MITTTNLADNPCSALVDNLITGNDIVGGEDAGDAALPLRLWCEVVP